MEINFAEKFRQRIAALKRAEQKPLPEIEQVVFKPEPIKLAQFNVVKVVDGKVQHIAWNIESHVDAETLVGHLKHKLVRSQDQEGEFEMPRYEIREAA